MKTDLVIGARRRFLPAASPNANGETLSQDNQVLTGVRRHDTLPARSSRPSQRESEVKQSRLVYNNLVPAGWDGGDSVVVRWPVRFSWFPAFPALFFIHKYPTFYSILACHLCQVDKTREVLISAHVNLRYVHKNNIY